MAVAVSTQLSFHESNTIRHTARRGDRDRPQPKDFHVHGAGHGQGWRIGCLISGNGVHQG